MSDLLALAERCEQATGPDRQMNKEIDFLINPPKPPVACEDEPPAGFGCGFLYGDYWGLSFTGSIDAAMTLVPRDMSVTIMFGPWVAGSVIILDPVSRVEWRADALTPALALCAAALRARASQPTEGSE